VACLAQKQAINWVMGFDSPQAERTKIKHVKCTLFNYLFRDTYSPHDQINPKKKSDLLKQIIVSKGLAMAGYFIYYMLCCCFQFWAQRWLRQMTWRPCSLGSHLYQQPVNCCMALK
jgi:hypothetical protein